MPVQLALLTDPLVAVYLIGFFVAIGTNRIGRKGGLLLVIACALGAVAKGAGIWVMMAMIDARGDDELVRQYAMASVGAAWAHNLAVILLLVAAFVATGRRATPA